MARRLTALALCLILLPLSTGKKLDDLLKRVEQLEAKLEAAESEPNREVYLTKTQVDERFRLYHQAAAETAAAAEAAGPHEVYLTKAEVHERFQLFSQAQSKELFRMQEQVEELRAQMRGLHELLLVKADANEVMTKAEVHERFRLFAAGRPAKVVESPVVTRCDHLDVMSRTEVHERFRLFANAGAALGSCECTNCTCDSASGSEVPLPAKSSWIGWIFSTCILGAGLVLGVSLCVAGESKALEDRLNLLEERVEDAKLASVATSVTEGPPKAGLAMRGKVLSGAAGAAVGSTTGAISGSLAGGAFGALAGLVPAIFTFGLSIPLGAAVGSTLGMVGGSVVGGGTGAVGGVQAAQWYKARKDRC